MYIYVYIYKLNVIARRKRLLQSGAAFFITK